VERLAHKLLGAAAMICAGAIVDVVLQIETAVNDFPWDVVCMFVKRLEEAFVEFKEVLSEAGIPECIAKY
jgi:HPt (histidine-containing phosphotransfer) domain-containing protein